MKKKHKRIVLAGTLIIIFAMICGGFCYYRSIFTKQLIPDFKLVGNIDIKVHNDTSFVSIKVSAENNTFLDIDLDTLKYNISTLNKKYMQHAEYLGLTLYGNSTDTIDLTLKIPHSTILADLQKARKKTDNIVCGIQLFIAYETIFGKSEMPLITTVKITLIQPPELEIQSIHYTKLGLKTILADASIKIVNHSSLNLMVKKMSYYMNIYKMGNLSGYNGVPIIIGPRETTIVTLPITIEVDHLGKTLYAILFNNDIYNYSMTLQAEMESVDPFKRIFNLTISKNGQMKLRKRKPSSERQKK